MNILLNAVNTIHNPSRTIWSILLKEKVSDKTLSQRATNTRKLIIQAFVNIIQICFLTTLDIDGAREDMAKRT